MRKQSGSDISDLEEDKQPYKQASYKNHSNLLEESEVEPSERPFIESLSLTIAEPERIKEGRDSYYVYPIYHKSRLLSTHRYKEFVWLRNELSIHFPACAAPALPDKEGVIGYWSNQDPLFYKFRRYGLEKFLQRIAAHSKLNKSQDFVSFLHDDEVNFHIRVKKSESNRGWYGKISDWSSSIAGYVTGYISSEPAIQNEDEDFEFSNHRNEIKILYQQQEALCAQGRSLVTCEENEIAANLALGKAYENMNKVEKEGLADKLKVLAETHLLISDAHRSCFDKLKELVGQELEDYKRITFGLLEALERRIKIRSEKNLMAQFDMREINNDLKKEIARFNSEKNFLSQVVSQKLILYKQELTEKISEVWRDAHNKIS